MLKKACTNYNQLGMHLNDSIQMATDIEKTSMVEHDKITSEDWTNSNSTHIDRANPEDFMHLFSSPEQLIDFLEHLLLNTSDCSQLIYNTLVR